MPHFAYKAFKVTGEPTSGFIEAADYDSALVSLSADGLIPYEAILREHGETIWEKQLFNRSSLSDAERFHIAHTLSMMITSGFSVHDSFLSLYEDHTNMRVTNFANNVIDQLESGEHLNDILRTQSAFKPEHLSIIDAAYGTGKLGSAFSTISGALDGDLKIRSELISALIYPFLLLSLSVLVMIFIITVLLPSLAPIFEDTGQNIPAFTQALMNLGVSVRANPLLYIAVSSAIILAVFMALQNPKIKKWYKISSFNWPIVGKIQKSFLAKQFCHNMGLLISNDVPIMKAINTLRNNPSHPKVQEAYDQLIEGLKSGQSFSDLSRQIDWLPMISKRLIAMGEKTGQLGDTLVKAANILQIKNRESIQKLSRLMTPVLTLLTGLIIGIIVISVLSAILSINDFAA